MSDDKRLYCRARKPGEPSNVSTFCDEPLGHTNQHRHGRSEFWPNHTDDALEAGYRQLAADPEYIAMTEARRAGRRPLNVAAAKAVLKQHDYVVVKTKSYQAAQQRLAIAKAEAQWERDGAERTRRWAQTELGSEIRDLRSRCTYLYGLAAKLGATREQLSGQN